MLEKTTVMKVLEKYKKTFLGAFLLKYSSSPPIPPQLLPLYALQIFKTVGRASVVESLFSKATETSVFLQLCREI